MRKTDKFQHNQEGFASLVIALVLIIILALLTTGFAALARREQQNSLDKQLANQAYYAAESGVNDVSNLVTQAYDNQSNLAYTGATVATLDKADSNTCLNDQPSNVPTSQVPSGTIDSTFNVEYTCALLDMHPASLIKSQLGPNTSWATTFSTNEIDNVGSPAVKPLRTLTINWFSNDGRSTRSGGGFTAVGSWGAMAVLQISLTPLGEMDRADLLNNTFSADLYPQNSGGSISYTSQSSASALAQAPVVNGTCQKNVAAGTPMTCSVTIMNLTSDPGNSPGERYLLNISDYYDTSDVSITKALDTSNKPLDFYDSQAQIDVTGKDKDVLKRIQVRVPLGSQNDLPSYAIQGQDVCKRQDTAPSNASTNPNGTTYETAGGSATPTPEPDGSNPCSFDGNLQPSN